MSSARGEARIGELEVSWLIFCFLLGTSLTGDDSALRLFVYMFVGFR